MKLKELPAINVVYKSKELEMMKRDDIIQRIQEFLTQGDRINSDRYEQFGNLNNNSEDVKYAYVVYLYGDGGIGKTCLCKMVRNQISVLSQVDQVVHRIYYDLAKNNNVVSKLIDLSMVIRDSFENSEMFPLFDYAYNVYISKSGEQLTKISRQTDSDSAIVDIALSIASCVPGISNVADVVNAGKAVISLIHKYRKDKSTSENFHVIDNIPLEELKARLGQYFAKDLNAYFNQHSKERLIIILDTFENFLYNNPKNGRVFNSTDWLFGNNGIICLLQNTFWVIAGREEIDWEVYDSESHEISFHSISVGKPNEEEVKHYLIQAGFEPYSAEEIAKSTVCYPLHFGMCVDLFFKLWNENLQESYGNNKSLNDCKPGIEEVTEIIKTVKDSSIVSDRVLGYFNKQERDIIFTLACLKRWTDELLSEVIWKYSSSNFTFYESIKGFSFIKKYGTVYEFQTEALSEIVISCPNLIKRNLISSITIALDEGTSLQFLLIQSLFHITLYYQTEINPWEKVVWYLYGGMFSLLQSNMFGTVDELCARLFNLIKIANQSDKTDNAFKFSIWVWQYVSAVVQNSLDNTDSVIVNYFHISENVPERKYTPDECLKEMEKLLKDLSPDELSIEYRWAVEAVYRWLTQYELYQEAYVIVQLILSRFSQPLEKAFPKYKTYQAAIMADAKLCYLSWNRYEGRFNDSHTVEIDNMEVVLKKLAVLIDYIEKHAKNLNNYLKDFIAFYVRLVKQPAARYFLQDKPIVELSDDAMKNFDRFLKLYKKSVNPNNVQELINLKLLECGIAGSDKDYKTMCRKAFQGIHLIISEYGVDLEDLSELENLCRYAKLSLSRIEFGAAKFIPSKEMASYKRLFNEVVSAFCKTANLKYYDLIHSFNRINRGLFENREEVWYKYILQLNNSPHKDLRKRIVLVILYDFYGYNGNQKCFHKAKKKWDFYDLENQPVYDDPECFRLLDDAEIDNILSYASNNNHFCYEMLQRLEELYSVADDIKKIDLSETIVEYIAGVFYNAYGISWSDKKALLYKIFSYIDKSFLTPIENDIVMSNEHGRLENLPSCFDAFRGWIFYLDYEVDKKINQHVLDLLYSIMTSGNFQITETFSKAVEKALNRFWGLKLNLEAGINIVKFLNYVTQLSNQNSVTEAAIKSWKGVLPKRTNLSYFDNDSIVRDALIDYGVLDPMSNVSLNDLIASGKFSDAQEFIKRLLKIDQEYYEPIVFQQGKAAILQRIDKIKSDIKSEPIDEIERDRNVFRREVVLEGYHDYKTREEFLAFVYESIDDFCKDAESNVAIFFAYSYFENILKLLTATQNRDLIRKYVFAIKRHDEDKFAKGSKHTCLIRSYKFIKDYVDISEILDNDIIEKMNTNLEQCKKLYSSLNGLIPAEQLDNVILDISGKNLDILQAGIEWFYVDGIDGSFYHWLQELWGNRTDELVSSRYPYVVAARNLYKSRYRVEVE